MRTTGEVDPRATIGAIFNPDGHRGTGSIIGDGTVVSGS
jgi:hypothetical protein